MRLVGDHCGPYEAGEFILLGSNLPHTWWSEGPRSTDAFANRAIVIQFHPPLLPDNLLALPDFASVAQMIARARLGLHFSLAAADELGPLLRALPEKKGLSAWLSLVELLGLLSLRTDFKTLASDQYRDRRPYQVQSRLGRVLTFMDENCGNSLELPAVARIAHLSPSAFSKFFHKMTGKTFVEHRNVCRVREACRLLTQTDASVTEIAYQSGFSNLANFNRQFLKQKQLSPLKYRRLRNPL